MSPNAHERTSATGSTGFEGSFDEIILPHLVAARRLARWLMRNEHDAEDVVQEAAMLAFRHLRTFTGGDGRAWFFKIVRNTCWSRRGRRPQVLTDSFDEEQHSHAQPASDPETLLLRADDMTLIERAMSELPDGLWTCWCFASSRACRTGSLLM